MTLVSTVNSAVTARVPFISMLSGLSVSFTTELAASATSPNSPRSRPKTMSSTPAAFAKPVVVSAPARATGGAAQPTGAGDETGAAQPGWVGAAQSGWVGAGGGVGAAAAEGGTDAVG